MAVDLAKLVVRMEADNAKLIKQLDQANGHLRKFDRAAGGALKSLKSLAGGLGVGLIFTKFASDIKTVIDEADNLSKLSQSVGVSVEALSGLQYAADLSGVSLDQLGTGLKKLAVNASDTARDTGEAKDAFKALNISVLDAAGGLKDSDKLLAEIATRFAGMEDGAGKSAIAMKLFGKSGADLIPLLNSGADGIAAMTDEARQFGVVLDADAAKSAERFNDNLSRMEAASKGLKIEVANQLLPALENITNAMVAAAKEAGLFEAILVSIGGAMYNLVVPSDHAANAVNNINDEVARLEQDITALSQLKAISPLDYVDGKLDNKIAAIRVEIKGLQQLANDIANPIKVLPDNPTNRGEAAAGGKQAAPLIEDPNAAKEAQRALDKALADSERAQEQYQKSLQSLADALDPVSAKSREAAENFELLGRAQDAGDISLAEYNRLTKLLSDELSGASEAAKKHTEEMDALLQSTIDAVDPNRKLVEELEKLDELLNSPVGAQYGDVLLERMLQINEAMDDTGDKADETTDIMTEFALEAARNMQSAFADFLFDPFSEGIDGMAKGFGKVLQRMIAEATAAKIFESLGGLGGPVGGFFGALTGAHAAGTNFATGGLALVGERGPEVVNLPRGSQVIPNQRLGGNSTTINVSVTGMSNPAEVRRAAGQGAREALAAMNVANRYG